VRKHAAAEGVENLYMRQASRVGQRRSENKDSHTNIVYAARNGVKRTPRGEESAGQGRAAVRTRCEGADLLIVQDILEFARTVDLRMSTMNNGPDPDEQAIPTRGWRLTTGGRRENLLKLGGDEECGRGP
jgi:hypothetical protein